jgi:hypothetical protein
VKLWLRTLLVFALLSAVARAHVVAQIYGEWKEPSPGAPWSMEVLFEAGYAVPDIRDDPAASAPERDWLLAESEESWQAMREEAEHYLRQCLAIRGGETELKWTVEFPDFAKRPPDFPVLLNNGAYLRMVIRPEAPPAGPVTLLWKKGERPTFILKMARAEGGYVTLDSGDQKVIEPAAAAETAGTPVVLEEKSKSSDSHGSVWTAFRQGYQHVVPRGWDHILFVLGLFFYRRRWKPMLNQSLAFTAAHTVTLGLAAAGVVKISGHWVEPMIALSLVAVALENLRAEKSKAEGRVRLLVVFGFGLVHGLGFAGTMSAWLKPGEGFLPSLLSANLGVEAAQATLLAGGWLLTLGWSQTSFYRVVRLMGCWGIAAIGAYWALQRVGWI